jgi:hypothetical protein
MQEDGKMPEKGRGLKVADGTDKVKVCPLRIPEGGGACLCGDMCAWWDEDGDCCKVVLALDRVEDGLPLIAEAISGVAGKLDAVIWALTELGLKVGVKLGK